MIDRLERIGADAQLDRAAERVRDQRHVEQVGQEAPLGLDVGVADLVSDLRRLAGQIASPRHGSNLEIVDCCWTLAGACGRAIGPSVALVESGGPIVSTGKRVKPRVFVHCGRRVRSFLGALSPAKSSRRALLALFGPRYGGRGGLGSNPALAWAGGCN